VHKTHARRLDVFVTELTREDKLLDSNGVGEVVLSLSDLLDQPRTCMYDIC